MAYTVMENVLNVGEAQKFAVAVVGLLTMLDINAEKDFVCRFTYLALLYVATTLNLSRIVH